MKLNSKLGLALAIFIAVIVALCVFMIIFMPRERFHIGFFGFAKLRHTTNLNVDNKTTLDITAYSDNLYFQRSSSDELIIKEYYASSTKKASIHNDGQTVTFRGEHHINMMVFGAINEKIVVYLPQNFSGNIRVSLSSGTIKSDLDFVAENLTFEATSGTINLRKLTAGNINVKASSGSIKLDEVIGNAMVKVSSGTVRINRLVGLAEVDASSGGIRVMDIKGGISARASSGTVKLDVTELLADVNAATTSGSINIKLPMNSNFNFSAETTSGTIRTNFDKNLSFNSRKNTANGAVGSNPVHNVTARASSGSVRVDN